MKFEDALKIRFKLDELDKLENIIQLFGKCKLCLRHNNGGIAHTFGDTEKDIIRTILLAQWEELKKEISEI